MNIKNLKVKEFLEKMFTKLDVMYNSLVNTCIKAIKKAIAVVDKKRYLQIAILSLLIVFVIWSVIYSLTAVLVGLFIGFIFDVCVKVKNGKWLYMGTNNSIFMLMFFVPFIYRVLKDEKTKVLEKCVWLIKKPFWIF